MRIMQIKNEAKLKVYDLEDVLVFQEIILRYNI